MTTITIQHYTEEGFDCECCGYSYPEGVSVQVNGEEVWEKYSDGHMYGRETEDTVLNCILNAWGEARIAAIEAEYTEEKRLEWDEQHKGNGIADTAAHWMEQKLDSILYLDEYVDTVRTSCAVLPYELNLQVKMIALWIQDACGEEIEVTIENDQHGNEYDEL